MAIAAVAAPLYFNPWSTFIFEPDKAWVVRLTALAFIVPAIYSLRGWSWLHLPWALVLASYIVSTALSKIPILSIEGWFRGQGLLTVAAYMALALAASTLDRNEVDRLLRIMLWGSVPVCLYAIAQRTGHDPLAFVHWTRDAQRPFSSLGGAPWLGAYLAMLLPFAIWYRQWAIGALEAATLLLTLSAAPIAAAAVGCILLAFVGYRQHLFPWQVASASAAALLLMVGFALYFPRTLTIDVHRQYWDIGLAVMRNEPVYGWGLETQMAAMRQYVPPGGIDGLPDVDRAHDGPIDVLDERGPLGLEVDLILAACVAVAAWRIKGIGLPILASLTIHVITSLGSIESVSTQLYAWLLVGVVIALSMHPRRAVRLPGGMGRYLE